MCRGLFCVATTRNVGQDLATFGDVGDMSGCRRHVADTSATCGAKPTVRYMILGLALMLDMCALVAYLYPIFKQPV